MVQALSFLANPAFWSGAGNAASAAGGIANIFGLGKKEKGSDKVDMYPSWVKDNANLLSNWAKQYVNNFVPGEEYTGDYQAPATGYEQTGLSKLGQFLSSPGTGDLFNASKSQVMDTLSGKYADPNQSPFIQAMTALSNKNLEDQINAARASAGGRGKYFSTNAINQEGKIRENSVNNLNALIGDFINNERSRMFQAAPIAQTLDQYANMDVPLKQIGASQTYGNLERTIANADLESRYQDYLRQRTEQQVPIKVAQGLASGSAGPEQLQSPVTESNSLSNILSLIGKLNFGGIQSGNSLWGNLNNLLKLN